ncbi:uncharacterized protein H6S33_011093 [Morchella sextelata]|uniref:uncharacterized protein n=1 Tax=Morchella sextelata TaxID=1174677 RepID=UPI001D0567BA|nr:uncharacterized protein H6S33_011093 [Morchella sextelata]KAH0611828.1 hypothetical protein H6S33_011093 [Morchella sextelata]
MSSEHDNTTAMESEQLNPSSAPDDMTITEPMIGIVPAAEPSASQNSAVVTGQNTTRTPKQKPTCGLCRAQFTCNSSLDRHWVRHFNNPPTGVAGLECLARAPERARRFYCPGCRKYFSRKKAFKEHVKVHERPNETTNTAAIFKNVCADSLAALAAAATRAAGDVSSVVVFVQAPPKEMESKKSALSQGTPSASNAG